MPEMWPTSVAMPVAVTTNSPEPRVTLVFMYTMSVRSPSGVPAPSTGSVPLATGRLSPVSADSATSSVAARSSRPSAGTMSPASIADDVAGDELPGGDLRQLAVPHDLGLDDHHLLEGGDGRGRLPLLMQAENRVEQRQQDQDDAGLPLLQEEAHDAGHQQDDLHRVGVLADERAPPGLGLPGVELVRAEPLGPRGGLGRAETETVVHLLLLEDPIGAQRVPYGSVGIWRQAGCGYAGSNRHLSSPIGVTGPLSTMNAHTADTGLTTAELRPGQWPTSSAGGAGSSVSLVI